MSVWEGVSEFVAVAETNSFTAASVRLSISTAQVSRQISALETRLNVKLFYRTTRKVSLTQEGDLYYQHCRKALHDLVEAEANITRSLKEPTGKVRLTAPTTFGSEIIAPLINDFLLHFPKVEVDFHLTNRRVDLIDEGYDLAIRLGKLADSTMIAKKLAGRFNYVCLSPRYKAEHGEPKCLGELQHHNCLIGSNDCWRFHVDGKDKAMKVSGKLRCNNGYGLLDAALKGIGIVQLPDQYVTPYIETGQLLPVLTEYAEPQQGIWVVYPHNKQLSPKIRLLIDHLSEGITAQEAGLPLLQPKVTHGCG